MILVTGATGLNRSELVHKLSAEGVPVRSAARAEGLSALPQVEIVQGDMERPETLTGALRGVDLRVSRPARFSGTLRLIPSE